MKKGFTLVEIIISISIILIVGVSTTFFIINKKNDNELEKISKIILESANTYINVESDKEGNTFLKQIYAGRAGVQIPLTKLVEKGYIEDNLVATLEKEKGSNVIKENYVLALLGDGTEENECDGISLKISWDINTNDEVYLCKKNEVVTSTSFNYLIYLVPDNCELSEGDEVIYMSVGIAHKLSSLKCPEQDYAYFVGWKKVYDTHLEGAFNPELVDENIDFYTSMNEEERNNILKSGEEILINDTMFLKPVYYMPVHTDVPGVLYSNSYQYNATNNNVSFANKLWKALDDYTMILNESIGSTSTTLDIQDILDEWYENNLKYYEKECSVKKSSLRILTKEEFEKASKSLPADGYNSKRSPYHLNLIDDWPYEYEFYGNLSFLKSDYSYWIKDGESYYAVINAFTLNPTTWLGTDWEGSPVCTPDTVHVDFYDNYFLSKNRDGLKLDDVYEIRPVMNIPSCKDTLHIPGDGTEANPYIISKPNYLK